jgi:cytidylate kinase
VLNPVRNGRILSLVFKNAVAFFLLFSAEIRGFSRRDKPDLPFGVSGMAKKSKQRKLTIAIDGPSGAGKSTAGKSLAKRLGYIYIDTGAMYRTVALKVKEQSLAPKDEKGLYRLASSLEIVFVTKGEGTHVLCNGQDVTEAIRSPEISRLASNISMRKGVREALVEKQREMGRGGGVVLEGRDIGTVVFPDADVKFYLDAEKEERGRRRFKELIEKGMKVSFNETLEEVMKRDHNDMNRDLSPLKRTDDAFFMDSTHRTVEEIVEEMVCIVKLQAQGTGHEP